MDRHTSRFSYSRFVHTALAIALGVAVVGLVTVPAEAQQRGRYRAQCAKIDRQLVRYTGVVKMARARDDDAWESATRDQVHRLETRQKAICPEQYAAARTQRAARDTALFFRNAGQLALRYFTFGAL